MKIIEYNHTYAQKVADMWNLSKENWGNENTIKTAQDVIDEENSHGNKALYLAMDNDEVVGYCSFGIYRYDSNATYLPLLNVRPDYHGKKVGKKLILKVIEDAIKEKEDRFDLFTWSGNVKAMPLYKKCGFFWERRKNTVHLMNFLPYIHHYEGIYEYFKVFDWYKDSKREIKQEQDGIKRDGFEFYDYHFENENHVLKLEFEKTSRKLTYIETDDYIIKTSIKKHELIFDNDYDITYEILNKTGKKLDITFKGYSNELVEYDYSNRLTIDNKCTVSTTFYVKKYTKPIQDFKTFLSLDTLITVNGTDILFGIGIYPKYPLDIKLHLPTYTHKIGNVYKGYINLENNLDEEVTYKLSFNNKLISFEELEPITLQSKEKQSSVVNYSVLEYGYYKEDVVITYKNKSVNKEVDAPIRGLNSSFIGVTDQRINIYKDNNLMTYDIDFNEFEVISSYNNPFNSQMFFAPSIGKPYEAEFDNYKPKISVVNSNEVIMTFHSKKYKDISIILHISLKGSLLQAQYSLANKGEPRTLSLSVPIWQRLSNHIVPYKGKLIKLDMLDTSLKNLDASSIDETWFYNYKDHYGMHYDKSFTLKLLGWKVALEMDDVLVNERVDFKPISILCDKKDVVEFREAFGYIEKKDIVSMLDVDVNNGNIFYEKDYVIKQSIYRKSPLQGALICDDINVSIDEEILYDKPLSKTIFDCKDKITTYPRYLFKTSGNIKTTKQGNKIVVDNGLITLVSDLDHSYCLTQLLSNGVDVLDTDYPDLKNRSWWDIFNGGIESRFSNIKSNSLINQKIINEVVTIKDNFDNLYTGIKISIEIIEDKDYKGLLLDTYYLTKEGTSMMVFFTVLNNRTNKFIGYNNVGYYLFFKYGKNSIVYNNNSKIKLFDIEIDDKIDNLAKISSDLEEYMYVYRNGSVNLETSLEYALLFSNERRCFEDKEQYITKPTFVFFTKEDVTKEHMKNCNNIKFEVLYENN